MKGYVPGVSLRVFTNPESTDPIKHTNCVYLHYVSMHALQAVTHCIRGLSISHSLSYHYMFRRFSHIHPHSASAEKFALFFYIHLFNHSSHVWVQPHNVMK